MSAPPEDGKTASGSDDGPAAGGGEDGVSADGDVDRLRSRVSQLETELDRKDAELASVRRQYEAILDDETFATQGDPNGDDDTSVFDLLR